MKYGISDVALVVEYPWRFGGSQRLACVLADYWRKPFFLYPCNEASDAAIWNSEAVKALPSLPIVFSVVVDERTLQVIPDKINIKFCHDANTLRRFTGDKRLLKMKFLTHRKRVYDFYASQGLNITLINEGYIPYENWSVSSQESSKEFDLVMGSRLCADKTPIELLRVIIGTNCNTVVLGSTQDKKYFDQIKTELSAAVNVMIPSPDLEHGFSDEVKFRLFRKSSILVHYSDGGLKDELEYVILDGMIAGAIPLCMTPDPSQFKLISEQSLGAVVNDMSKIEETIRLLLDRQDFYRENCRQFITSFLAGQSDLKRRWTDTLEKVINS
jgi:hypothetical protein